MREVIVTAYIDATPEVVFELLSPESIVEYERTYDVESVTRTDETWQLTVISRNPDLRMELEVRERPDGYSYELVGGGPFEELSTSLTVDSGPDDGSPPAEDEDRVVETGTDPSDAARVTMTSRFTFGGWLAPVLDRLAASNREQELERALRAIAAEVAIPGDSTGSDSDSPP